MLSKWGRKNASIECDQKVQQCVAYFWADLHIDQRDISLQPAVLLSPDLSCAVVVSLAHIDSIVPNDRNGVCLFAFLTLLIFCLYVAMWKLFTSNRDTANVAFLEAEDSKMACDLRFINVIVLNLLWLFK